ncbi:DUF2637 domain-containing protein [Streptosporangium soli]|nr:DUF2637 domain-containing protein [Streptosporangium sp. KLBMP 9127]
MDASPPAAAGQSSRPSPATEPGRMTLTLRRLGIALTGLGVTALGATACVLSFDDFRVLAEKGQARADLAYLYPAGFDALLAVALISVLLLRSARLHVRLQAAVVLVLLVLAAATVEVTTAVGTTIDVRQAAVGVAVTPWVMLVIALWLWLLMIKHAHDRRGTAGQATGDQDIVPFHRAPVPEPPAASAPEPAPAPDPVPSPVPSFRAVTPAEPAGRSTAAPVAEPVSAPIAEPVAEPVSAPVAGPAIAEPVITKPVTKPVSEPVAGPVIAEPVAAEPAPAAASRAGETSDSSRATPPPLPVRVAGANPNPRSRSLPPRSPDLPLRWGDLIRSSSTREPTQDILVHPRPAPETPGEGAVGQRVESWETAGPQDSDENDTPPPAVREADKDTDTQPLRAFGRGRSRTGARDTEPDVEHPAAAVDDDLDTGPDTEPDIGPVTYTDPIHGADLADGEEQEQDAPSTGETPSAPPSGRMRSTPLPPED